MDKRAAFGGYRTKFGDIRNNLKFSAVITTGRAGGLISPKRAVLPAPLKGNNRPY